MIPLQRSLCGQTEKKSNNENFKGVNPNFDFFSFLVQPVNTIAHNLELSVGYLFRGRIRRLERRRPGSSKFFDFQTVRAHYIRKIPTPSQYFFNPAFLEKKLKP